MLYTMLVALLVSAPAAQADTGAVAKASAPFYAALVASAHGNIDATNRQLLLLAARWDAAIRELRAGGPAALTQDPAWGAALDRASAMLTKARELARTRDIAGAHAQLEEIRLMLHEIRERHGVWSFDDHLAEYHEMIERVSGHVSGRSEINLTPRDYQDIDEDLQGARKAWADVEKTAAGVAGTPAWREAATASSAALDQFLRALAAKNRAGVAEAAERVKTTYLELLTAVAKARG